MSTVYDNWGRLVRSTLLREELRRIANDESASTSVSSYSGSISSSDSSISDLSVNYSVPGILFTYQQICGATDYFSDASFIKHGHSGDLFRGVLDDGVSVVIKRIDLRLLKWESYVSELEFLSKSSHPRFVNLVGHCVGNEAERFLVYEYLPNADLSNALSKKNVADGDPYGSTSLDWIRRLKIATEVAQGLVYLHDECSPPLIHRNVQASSILLDEKFEARLGSLSEICAQSEGPRLNRITRMLWLPRTSKLRSPDPPNTTCAYDVYCFGKVLLELVTGRSDIGPLSNADLKKLLAEKLPCISLHDRNLVTKIVDPSLVIDEDLLDEVWAIAIVAKACLHPKPSKRPLMKFVLKGLENPLVVVRKDDMTREENRMREDDRTREALTKTQKYGQLPTDKRGYAIVTHPNGVVEYWDQKKVRDHNVWLF